MLNHVSEDYADNCVGLWMFADYVHIRRWCKI